MADPNVKLHFAAEGKSAEAVVAGLERKITALDAKLKHGFGGGRGGKHPLHQSLELMRETASELSRELLGFSIPTTPLEAVREILAAIRREIENIHEVHEKARFDELGFEGILKETWMNLGVDKTIPTSGRLVEIIEKLATDAGVSRETAAGALSYGFTARAAGIPAMDVVETGEAVLPVMAGMDDASIRAMMLGTTALRNLYPKTDPRDIFGWMDIVSTISPVATLDKFARHVVPPMAATAAVSGDSLRYLAAENTTIMGLMTDIHGRRAATASLLSVMRIRKTLTEKLAEEFPELTTQQKRMEFMWANPDLAEAFVHGGEWEGRKFKPMQLPAKARPAYEMFIKGDPKATDKFKAAYRDIPDIESGKGRARYEADIKAFAAMSPALMGELDRRMEHAAVSLRTLDPAKAEAGIVRAGLPEILQATDMGAHQQRAVMALWELGTNIGRRRALTKAIDILQTRADVLGGVRPRETPMAGEGSPWMKSPIRTTLKTVRGEPTEMEREQIAVLREQIEQLKGLNKKLEAKKVNRAAHAEKVHE
jgi:hypothetical protein